LQNDKHDLPLRLLPGALIPLLAAFLIVRAFGPAADYVRGDRWGRIVSPGYPVLGPKFERFAPRADRYSVVFIGSSVSYHGVIPRVFDEESRRAGAPQTSFNFSAPNLSLAEADFLVDAILRAGPRNLKWILVDMDVGEGNWEHWLASDRFVYWNSPGEIALMTRYTLAADFSLATLAGLLPHWRAAYENFWSPGRGQFFLRGRLSFAPARTASPAENEGYQSLESLGVDAERRTEFLAARGQYLRSLPSFNRPPAEGAPPGDSAYRAAMLLRMSERARSRGVALVYYVPPLAKWVRAPRPPPGSPFLAFDSLQDYPELFRFESRFDGQHLTESAAGVFTRLLARGFRRLTNGPGVQSNSSSPRPGS
jgi:hypothetical protein